MNSKRFSLAMIVLWLPCALNASAQVDKSPNPPAAPPNMLVLVHQEYRFDKQSERQKLELAIMRACDHLKVPKDWIDLESISGPPEALFFDPFDSIAKDFADGDPDFWSAKPSSAAAKPAPRKNADAKPKP